MPFPLSAAEPKVDLKTAQPGKWELSRAQFLLRQPGIPRQDARNVMEDALEKLPPGDARMHEALWLYKLALSEEAEAYEELSQAIKAEAGSPELRLQWCIETLNRSFRSNNGIYLAADKAREVADLLQVLNQANEQRRIIYDLYAPSDPIA